MSRYFNTTGSCNPQFHYMVDIQERLSEIKKLVDDGKYFTINRARQYGKTTTLTALASYLSKDYIVIFLDFLSQFRAYYLNRIKVPSFWSVILAFRRQSGCRFLII